MQKGYFDDQNKEYVITDPRLPVRWINYVGTLDFGGFVDHNGGGVLCQGDPALNRITKYIPQLPPSDMNGQTCYVRVKEGDEYRLFSPFFTPVLTELDKYECRVGLGYNHYVAEAFGVRCEVTVFVPTGERRELRLYKVTNLSQRAVEVDLIPVVEYTHFDALKQFTNADWVPQTMMSRLVEGPESLKALTQFAFMKQGVGENFFTSSIPFSSFETDRQDFLGDFGYGTWKSPKALEKGELANREALRGDNIAALMVHLGALAVEGSVELTTQLGQTSDVKGMWKKIAYFNNLENTKAALKGNTQFWEDYLGVQQVETPDAGFNSMINIHNPRQCYMTGNWSRYLSSYQLGLGARGIGFRDSSQDSMGFLTGAPEEAKALMEKLLSVQCSDGHGMHQFFPSTMEANEGDSREEEDRPDYYGDDHLWIVMAVTNYLKETGDWDFLDKKIPFYDNKQEATVLEHLEKALEFTKNNTGAHGLPLLGFADWNDTVNLPTGAESFFIANQYGVALREIIGLFEFRGEAAKAKSYQADWEAMRSVFEKEGWDGAWYKRYYDDKGQPIGSHVNDKGQIYVNGQSWSVMSGFASKERAEEALDSVNEKLNTPKGIKLSAPGYDGYDHHIGGVTSYPPGAKENGGIFLHSNPWVMIAETMVGHGDRAYQYYKQINPAERNTTIEEYELEPYVYAQNFLGDEHPQFGLARNSWLSGTASWVYQAATKYILGIRPDFGGLVIDPCIPTSWEAFSVERKFRGKNLSIKVTNPQGVSKGVKSMILNGEAIEGNLLPMAKLKEHNQIEVVLG